jgi:uncharacterized membrane protein YtjA (UPF0391 family)
MVEFLVYILERIGELAMFRLGSLFLVTALAAALCGFDVITDLSLAAARLLFFVFLVLAVLAFTVGLRYRESFGDGELGGR